MQNEFTLLNVGDVFPFGTPKIPFLASLSQAPLTFVLTFPNIKDDDIEKFSVGPADFSFCQLSSGIISFLLRIRGFMNWSDSQYAPCVDLFEPAGLTLSTKLGTHTPTVLILVDEDTGIVKALRMVTVSHPFMFRLIAAVNDVKTKNLSAGEYESEAKKILDRYSTKDLVKKSKHVERGGKTVN